MKFNGFKKGLAATLAVCVMASSSAFVFADETASEKAIDFHFENVTNSTAALSGEAKIQVSVSGTPGDLRTIMSKITFEGDLKYKSIQFLAGTNLIPDGMQNSTAAAKANAEAEKNNGKGTLEVGISAIKDPIEIKSGEKTPLFILVFEGTADKSITVKSDIASSYCTYVGDRQGTKATEIDTASASAIANGQKSIKANVKLTSNIVDTFGDVGTGYKTTNIFVKLTNKNTKYTIYTDLSNVQYPNGNRYDNGGEPVFLFETNIVEGTYTVEISGPGYKPFTKDVTFSDSTKTVEYTNADFVPGDVDGDGDVDSTDKTKYEQLIADNDYSLSADFNRDGAVDEQDNIFPADNTGGNTGGTTGGNEGGSTGGSGESGNGGSTGNGGGSGGGGGGGAGGSGGGGAGGGFGGGTTTPTTPPATKTFTDLANYGWAENAIYTLKDKGIISGISNTEYAPANNIKRGDFILIITRMLKLENTFTENFADVPTTAYYYDALGKAKAAGIASGDGVNFMPENTITRQDLITLAYRAFLNAGYIEETTDYSVLEQFADKAEITDYAIAPLASMVAAGIITGDGTNVNPKGFATRAEVAVMCERLLALMK